MAHLIQCRTAKGVWKIKKDQETVGYMMVYVDDILITAKTDWIEATMKALQGNWDARSLGLW